MNQQPSPAIPPLPPGAPDPMFVGGTSRSGTHAMARLVGEHSRFRYIYREVRFHADQGSLPDLLAGDTTMDEFLAQMRGHWWKRERPGDRVGGLHGIIDEAPFERLLAEFERSFEDDPKDACRRLIRGILDPVAERAGKPSWIEQSTRNVARGPVLLDLFPAMKLIHTYRDGREVACSVVNRPWGPNDVPKALKRWERQLRVIDSGASRMPADKLMVVNLEDMVRLDREGSYRRLLDFLEIEDEPGMREYFDSKMTADRANLDRWRTDIDEAEQEKLTHDYGKALARLVGDGIAVAPELARRADLEPTAGGTGSRLRRRLGRLR
ncbi:MAG: sulfotransferase [Thermoleophilaceae bacterium]|nr:sulfotransferase [Thermoleophilaceae bacterium]